MYNAVVEIIFSSFTDALEKIRRSETSHRRRLTSILGILSCHIIIIIIIK